MDLCDHPHCHLQTKREVLLILLLHSLAKETICLAARTKIEVTIVAEDHLAISHP